MANCPTPTNQALILYIARFIRPNLVAFVCLFIVVIFSIVSLRYVTSNSFSFALNLLMKIMRF